MRNKLIMQSQLIDDDSELLQRLRDWNSHKKDYELAEIAKKASSAGVVNLDENQIKIMIIKLQQIEKLLKEVGKLKLNNKKTLIDSSKPDTKQTRRRSSVNSTVSMFLAGKAFRNSLADGGMNTIKEAEDNSDYEQLLKVPNN